MSVEQFNELITLLTDYGSPIVACAIFIMIVFSGFVAYRLFVWMNKYNQQVERKKQAIDIIRNDINHVKAFRRTENIQFYNYYVDCLIEDLDKLYHM